MLDNISLEFKDKSNAEKWFNENKDKFAQYNKQEINFVDNSFSTYPIKADVENLKYKITDKRAYLEGSMHKYWNNIKYKQFVLEGANEEENLYLKDNNWNEFYLDEITESINQLKFFFDGLELNEANITTLEFGFNLNVDHFPTQYIDFNFMMYEFKHPYLNTENFRMKKFNHSKFDFKVYNKTEQYGLNKNIFRIEIVLHSIHLKDLGVNKLDDLLNPIIIKRIYKSFYKKFAGFTIVDYRFNKPKIPAKIQHWIGSRFDEAYWKHLKCSNNIYRVKKRFNDTLKSYDLLNMRNHFMNLINRKFDKLFHGVDDVDD